MVAVLVLVVLGAKRPPPMIVFAALSSVVVGLGLLPMPYGYYALLRIVLCLSGATGFAAARHSKDLAWSWIYGVTAVLYNPILPVQLGSKPLWIGVNLVTLCALWAGAFRFRGTLGGRTGGDG